MPPQLNDLDYPMDAITAQQARTRIFSRYIPYQILIKVARSPLYFLKGSGE